MNIKDKMDSLNSKQLRQVISWTLNDLYNATHNYKGLDEGIKNWCAMLREAIDYQIDKAYNKLVSTEEE